MKIPSPSFTILIYTATNFIFLSLPFNLFAAALFFWGGQLTFTFCFCISETSWQEIKSLIFYFFPETLYRLTLCKTDFIEVCTQRHWISPCVLFVSCTFGTEWVPVYFPCLFVFACLFATSSSMYCLCPCLICDLCLHGSSFIALAWVSSVWKSLHKLLVLSFQLLHFPFLLLMPSVYLCKLGHYMSQPFCVA